MRNIILIIALFMGAIAHASINFKPKAVVVLVPGTFNSLVPGSIESFNISINDYYSPAVKKSIRNAGFDTLVINDLSPIGDFYENGRETYEQMKSWYQSKYPAADVPIILFGHSAGGFYALHAASLGKELPITKIVTLATPLKGSKLIKKVLGDQNPGDWDLGLRGLFQLSPQNVKHFLSKVNLDPKIKLFSIAGRQQTAPLFFKVFNSKYLLPALYPTAKILGEESDGVITVRSARGSNVSLHVAKGMLSSFSDLTDEYHFSLDHPEQVLDYRYFSLFGSTNKKYIRNAQLRFYGNLMNRVHLD